MAKVWFVRRLGAQWIAPGGKPAYERPLDALVFRLDLGPQRWLSVDRPETDTGLSTEDPATLQKVIVETTADDLSNQTFTSYKVGFYDSPYSPREVARRLDARGSS